MSNRDIFIFCVGAALYLTLWLVGPHPVYHPSVYLP